MKRPIEGALGVVLALGVVMMGTGCVAIEAGHEGVLVEQPFFFGHGGVDPVPAKTGRVVVSPTTEPEPTIILKTPGGRPACS